jgi:hypothetical protein
MASSPMVVSLFGSTTHSEREPDLETITIVVLVAAEDIGGCIEYMNCFYIVSQARYAGYAK